MAETLNLGNGNWGVKKDSLLGYNSENGNFKPLPFDFTRASSATVVNKAGLIETVGSGEPRIDFSNDVKGALLLEPTRSNLITYSEDFSNAAWSKFRTTITPNTIISPSGDLVADSFIEDSTNNTHVLRFNYTPNTSNYIFSVFAKSLSGNRRIRLSSSFETSFAIFNIENGTVVSSTGIDSSKIEDYGNGWYKCTVEKANNSISGNFDFRLDNGTTETYQGDGTSGVYIYGASLEQGSYATSYIPTQGSAVTRVADVCNQTVPSGIIGQTEGTIFLDFKVLSEDEINANIFNTNKNTTNAIAIIRTKSTKKIQVQTFFNSVNANYVSINPYDVGDEIKLAFKYKSGDIKFYINGILENSATPTFTISSSLSEINLADNVTYFARKEGVDYTSLQLYNTALTDAELQALTKI
jgi:hypothetical protein